MKKVFPQKVYYDIKEKLGEGLTSEVYRAYRVDEKAWTHQLVALKIIKSRKNIQILKKEFEKLTKVQSNYCVQVKAWENLPQGSALVLEFIDGVTLHELDQKKLLTPDLIEEVICQMSLGLMALHRQNIVHGDLNLKNVLIDTNGVVKLIDFGFYSSETESWLTPVFAAQSLLEGGEATQVTDRDSLDKIQKYLLSVSMGACGAGPVPIEVVNPLRPSGSRGGRRRTLSRIVRNLKKGKELTTQVIAKGPHRLRSKWGATSLAFAVFLPILLLTPLSRIAAPEFGVFEVQSRNWVGFSINSLPVEYSPASAKKLRSGRYQLSWKTAEGQGKKVVEISGRQKFQLKPYQDNL